MNWYYVEKEYYDYADDIEAVSIHYACTPLGSDPDWANQRITRYMPVLKPASQTNGQTETLLPQTFLPAASLSTPAPGRLRKKVLSLPSHLPSQENGEGSDRYLLHYYFEVCQDGFRRYSSLYTEEIVTSARTPEAALPQKEALLKIPLLQT